MLLTSSGSIGTRLGDVGYAVRHRFPAIFRDGVAKRDVEFGNGTARYRFQTAVGDVTAAEKVERRNGALRYLGQTIVGYCPA